MQNHCAYIKLKSQGKSEYPCFNAIVYVDKFGKGFCDKHKYCGVKPLQLALEREIESPQCGKATPSEAGALMVPFEHTPKHDSYVDLVSSRESLYDKFPIPQTLGELVEKHSCYLPKSKIKGCEWRMLATRVQGEINGLPMFRGFAVATNGVHVAIETGGGSLIFGHAMWFVVDKEDKHLENTLFNLPASKVTNTIKQIEELFTL